MSMDTDKTLPMGVVNNIARLCRRVSEGQKLPWELVFTKIPFSLKYLPSVFVLMVNRLTLVSETMVNESLNCIYVGTQGPFVLHFFKKKAFQKYTILLCSDMSTWWFFSDGRSSV